MKILYTGKSLQLEFYELLQYSIFKNLELSISLNSVIYTFMSDITLL